MTKARSAGLGLSPQATPWVALAVFCLLSILNFLDRNLIASAIPAIRDEFSLSDSDIGALSMSFAVVYAVGSIPLGKLADRYSRRNIILSMAGVWSLMTAACGHAGSFTQLLLGRMGVAAAEGGYMPAVYSSLSDMFSAARRNLVSALIIASCSLGTFAGLALGGVLTAHHGWRAAFFYVGLGGLLIVALAFLLIPEPERATSDARGAVDDSGRLGLFAGVARLLRDRVALYALLSTSFFTFSHGLSFWLPSFFQRTYQLPIETIGLLVGGSFGLGLGAGTLAGGFIGERLGRTHMFRPLLLCIVANALLIPTMATVLLIRNIETAIALTAVMSFAGGLAGPAFTSVMQNAAPPRLRGTAHGLLTLATSVFGYGLVPWGVGIASDYFSASMGAVEGLRYALLSATSLFVVALIFSVLAYRAGRSPAGHPA